MSKKVLVIDDAGFDRTIISALLQQSGFEVIGEASNGKEGLQMAKELNPDLITLDKLMPDMNGLEVLQALRDSDVNCEVALVSGDELDSIAEFAKSLGVKYFLSKPVTRNELAETLGKLA
jgi:two-component system chemotaxis response regulator CheY